MGWSDLETGFSRPAEMSRVIFVTWQCSLEELGGWKGDIPALEPNSMNAPSQVVLCTWGVQSHGADGQMQWSWPCVYFGL